MKTKLCRPVLVPTNEKSTFDGQLCLNGNHLFIARECDDVGGNLQPQKLILISLDNEEKIDDNKDRYFVSDNNMIKTVVNSGLNMKTFGTYFNIVATQSQLPPQYIQHFVEQYNEDKVEDIEIEMNSVFIVESSDKYENNDIIVNDVIADSIHYELEEELQKAIKRYNIPKLNNENQVQIVEKKPILYTEEEVKELLLKSVEEICTKHKAIQQIFKDNLSIWFEQNKKK